MSKLPPSYETKLDEEWIGKPEWVTLGWAYWRRGRGVLVLAGLVGMFLFFAPWVHIITPETMSLSGFDLARTLGWIWACFVAWLMLLATALSRRSVGKMRGARVAVSLFCAVPLVTILVIVLTPPVGGLVPIRFEYAWPFHATTAIALGSLVFAIRFGGGLKHLPEP